jgi:hypothetical protein
MKSLNETVDKNLSWIQPKALNLLYELRTEDELFGTLTFPKTFGSLAKAETADGKWTLKRVGYFNTRITIRKFGQENDIAVFKPNIMATTGIVHFANENSYQWSTSNFWNTKFEFKDKNGTAVVMFNSGINEPRLKDWFKTQARVEILDDKHNIEELATLIMLGWYLIIVLQMDSSAGAVVSAAT